LAVHFGASAQPELGAESVAVPVIVNQSGDPSAQ
jgi:hypothetical protein